MNEWPQFFSSRREAPQEAVLLDIFSQALEELFFVENPSLRKETPGALDSCAAFVQDTVHKDIWVFYPWRNTLVRMPEESVYYRLRTARNRNLISDTEQKAYRDAKVGIAGLSVGSAVAHVLTQTGGPKHLKLADPDTIDITNLNRIRATVLDVGANKTIVASRGLFELDPFLSLELFPLGITQDTLSSFLTEPRLSVFVDEMDNIKLKVESRVACKAAKIPVVMATDNGDSVIVDVERFDTEPERPIFHGRVTLSPQDLEKMDRATFVRLANEIIDPVFFTQKQQESIMEIGKSLSGVPQLSTAASIAGAAIAFVIRRIAANEPMPSGRYVLSCEEALIPNYNGEEQKGERAEHTKKFIDVFK